MIVKIDNATRPRDLRDVVRASEPYHADAAAVTNFHRVLAQRRAEQQRRQAEIKARSLLMSRRRKRSLPDKAVAAETQPAPKGETIMAKMTIEQAHERYVAGENVKKLAIELGMPWQRLLKKFDDAGLPRRAPKGNSSYPKPLTAERSPDVGAQTGAAETAVPAVKRAASPTPANGAAETAVARVDGVAGVARLLRELRQLDGVTVRGKVRLELEIELQ